MNSQLYHLTHLYITKHYSNKTRKDGTPQALHSFIVAEHLLRAGCSLNTICAGLLHDIVEDTPVTIEKIYDTFGEKIGNIVKEVTDDRTKTRQERKRLQYLNCESKSNEAKCVKLADMLHNLTSFAESKIWSFEDTQGYFIWKYHIFLKIGDVNSYLKEQLDKVFELEYDGKKLIPDDVNKKHLEDYFKSV